MAFNLKRLSGNIGAGGGTRCFTYGTTADDRATIEAVGYFDDGYLAFKVGDTILARGNDNKIFQTIVLEVKLDEHKVATVTTMSEGGA